MKQSIKFSVTLLVLIVSFGIVSALYLYSDDPQCANGFPEEGVGIACQEKFRGDTCPEDILESTKDTARMRAREDALEDAKETCSHMNCDCYDGQPVKLGPITVPEEECVEGDSGELCWKFTRRYEFRCCKEGE